MSLMIILILVISLHMCYLLVINREVIPVFSGGRGANVGQFIFFFSNIIVHPSQGLPLPLQFRHTYESYMMQVDQIITIRVNSFVFSDIPTTSWMFQTSQFVVVFYEIIENRIFLFVCCPRLLVTNRLIDVVFHQCTDILPFNKSGDDLLSQCRPW